LPRLVPVLGLCAAIAWSILGAGCGRTQDGWAFERALLDADRIADDERWVEAREAYLAIAPDATRDDLLRYIRFRVALMDHRRGAWDEALAGYAAVYRHPHSIHDQYAGRALLRSGELVLEAWDDREAWHDLMVATIRTYPNTTSADDALFDLRRWYVEQGRAFELTELLAELFVPLSDTEIGDNLAYWSARIVHEELGLLDEALPLYWTVAWNYHRSALVDDSIWRITEVYRELGRIDDEYRVLLDFIDGREVSWVMADYESEYYSDTLNRLAEIHEEREEWLEAIGMWRRYQRTYPLSLRNDDIWYHIIELHMTRGSNADAEKAWLAMRDEYPDSRWVPRARDLIDGRGGDW